MHLHANVEYRATNTKAACAWADIAEDKDRRCVTSLAPPSLSASGLSLPSSWTLYS